jgi:hypothetical protein
MTCDVGWASEEIPRVGSAAYTRPTADAILTRPYAHD